MKDLGFGNLGFINLTIVYLTFSINSVFAIKINKKLGTKRTLVASAMTYAMWIGCFILPAYRYENNIKTGIFSDTALKTLSFITAFLLGIGAGPLWVSQAFYLSECATHWTKGRYNGLFFCLFKGSNLLSYAITGVMIRNLKKTEFYIVMSAIGVTGSLFFLLLTKPDKVDQGFEIPQN